MRNRDIVWSVAVTFAVLLYTQADSCNNSKMQSEIAQSDEKYQGICNLVTATDIRFINDSILLYDNVLISLRSSNIRALVFELNDIKKQILQKEREGRDTRAEIASKQSRIKDLEDKVKQLAIEIKINYVRKTLEQQNGSTRLASLRDEKKVELQNVINQYESARTNCP